MKNNKALKSNKGATNNGNAISADKNSKKKDVKHRRRSQSVIKKTNAKNKIFSKDKKKESSEEKSANQRSNQKAKIRTRNYSVPKNQKKAKKNNKNTINSSKKGPNFNKSNNKKNENSKENSKNNSENEKNNISGSNLNVKKKQESLDVINKFKNASETELQNIKLLMNKKEQNDTNEDDIYFKNLSNTLYIKNKRENEIKIEKKEDKGFNEPSILDKIPYVKYIIWDDYYCLKLLSDIFNEDAELIRDKIWESELIYFDDEEDYYLKRSNLNVYRAWKKMEPKEKNEKYLFSYILELRKYIKAFIICKKYLFLNTVGYQNKTGDLYSYLLLDWYYKKFGSNKLEKISLDEFIKDNNKEKDKLEKAIQMINENYFKKLNKRKNLKEFDVYELITDPDYTGENRKKFLNEKNEIVDFKLLTYEQKNYLTQKTIELNLYNERLIMISKFNEDIQNNKNPEYYEKIYKRKLLLKKMIEFYYGPKYAEDINEYYYGIRNENNDLYVKLDFKTHRFNLSNTYIKLIGKDPKFLSTLVNKYNQKLDQLNKYLNTNKKCVIFNTVTKILEITDKNNINNISYEKKQNKGNGYNIKINNNNNNNSDSTITDDDCLSIMKKKFNKSSGENSVITNNNINYKQFQRNLQDDNNRLFNNLQKKVYLMNSNINNNPLE